MMIVEYQRPKNIQEALILLARERPLSYPLAGGTIINQGKEIDFAVVDLQSLRLDKITNKGKLLQIGAMVTLQTLKDYQDLAKELNKVIGFEATYNLRQVATVAGTIVSSNGRSPLTTSLLALDAILEMQTVNRVQHIKLGDWLAVRDQSTPGTLITSIEIPTSTIFSYEYIARTPADQPIICAAVAKWTSGRTRLALGGWDKAPILAMDGPNSDGIEIAGKNAYSHAADEWASAEYRQEMAGLLAMRCLNAINQAMESNI